MNAPNPESGRQRRIRAIVDGMAKRGYSREFPTDTSRRIKIEIDRVPPSLSVSLRAKCKREGISIRVATLRLWKEWVERPETEVGHD